MSDDINETISDLANIGRELGKAAKANGSDFKSDADAHMRTLRTHMDCLLEYPPDEQEGFLITSLISMFVLGIAADSPADALQHVLELYHIAPTAEVRNVIIEAHQGLVGFMCRDYESGGKMSTKHLAMITRRMKESMERDGLDEFADKMEEYDES